MCEVPGSWASGVHSLSKSMEGPELEGQEHSELGLTAGSIEGQGLVSSRAPALGSGGNGGQGCLGPCFSLGPC